MVTRNAPKSLSSQAGASSRAFQNKMRSLNVSPKTKLKERCQWESWNWRRGENCADITEETPLDDVHILFVAAVSVGQCT